MRLHVWNTATSVTLGIGVLVFVGCQLDSSRGPQPPPNAVELQERVDSTREQRGDVRKQIRAMTPAQLADKLEEDSVQGREPFNSPAYRELRRRGAGLVGELAPSITSPDRKHFLCLVSLFQLDRESYGRVPARLRMGILVNALRSSATFNTWGLPHVSWELAGRALILEGNDAIPQLRVLLQDQRLAPVWGSEEALESKLYGYRVCDYAWAMICDIRGLDVEIPKEAERRDGLIREELAR